MNRFAGLFIGLASVAITSCASSSARLDVRSLAGPAGKLRPGSELSDARALLALGNVGLALEGFRKVARDMPENAQAYAGIAACYDAMGRYDLSQLNYETALALEPSNSTLLRALAVAFDRQGNETQAAQARSEARDLDSPSFEQKAAELATGSPAPAGPSIAVRIPPAPDTVELAARGSITVTLPPARPVQAASAENAGPVPRLERRSLGEVQLVTIAATLPRSPSARAPVQTSLRWVPLNLATARPAIRILNAAKREGLAARSRTFLLGRGWRMIEIGDAADARNESVVLYPSSRAALGRNLASQFGFRSMASRNGTELVVLLGRDAAAAKLIRKG